MSARRPIVVENPLLVSLVVALCAAAYACLLFVLVFGIFESALEEQLAAGRAGCELVAPEVNGAFQHPSEVAAGSTARVAAPP